jgi:carbonic anhydrase
MLESGQIGVVGAMYNIETGAVEFYNDVIFIKDDLNPEFSVASLKY